MTGAGGLRPLPLRVALFAEQGHPGGSFRSGVTRITDQLVAACRRRDDVRLDFFTYHPSPGTDEDGGVRYHRVAPRLPVVFHGLRVDGLDVFPLVNPRFRRAVGEARFDVVLGTSPGIGTQGQLLARRQGIPFAVMHTTDLPHYAEELAWAHVPSPLRAKVAANARELAWRYLAWLYARKRTDLVLTPSETTRRHLLARADANVMVLGRGADTMDFPAVQRRGDGPVRLLYVGRVDYGQKNLAVVEQALRAVEGAVLWVVGDGDDLPLMRSRMAREEAEGRVVFTGRINDSERLKEMYLSADVFVFPSLFDTFAQVVVEAQRAGLPVVLRDRGGPQELVVRGRTGFVTESDDAFVERVVQLTADPTLRLSMGAAARVHASTLPTWADIMDQLLGHLGRLAFSGNAHPVR